ncbi:MAG: hypothetical protein M3198_15035 [Actinomycetota bacterium]|nr:hypothetical protein [Actinomycetota bacterium]
MRSWRTPLLAVLAVSLAVASVLVVRSRQRGWDHPAPLRPDSSILFSALAPTEAPDIFRRYFTKNDLARADTLPNDFDFERRRLYGLPTSLRREWEGFPGVRHWVEAGCGEDTPRTIIYDPENRELTPKNEQADFLGSINKAIRMVESTGCHDFGLAPGSSILFGLDGTECTYSLADSDLYDIDWTRVDLVDIQAQRLLSPGCLEKDGLVTYEAAVSDVAQHVRKVNPDILVFSQVSFRDNDPLDMLEGLQTVGDTIDGIYFSYPSNNTDIPCEYCSPENLELFLSEVR